MNQPTALIADDIVEMRQLLKRTLESLGFNVVALVGNGEDAINAIQSLKPDVCFLDIEMPKKDGLEILAEIKRLRISTFTVIISGYSSADNVKNAIVAGAKGFVVKPYSFEKIREISNKFYALRNKSA